MECKKVRRSRRDGLVAQISYAAVARYVVTGTLALRGFVLAFLMGPAIFGIWSSMRILLQFTRYSDAGARAGMIQLGTPLLGQGDARSYSQLFGAAAGCSLLGVLLVCGVVVAVAWRSADDAADLAQALVGLVAAGAQGLYHAAGSGTATWCTGSWDTRCLRAWGRTR